MAWTSFILLLEPSTFEYDINCLHRFQLWKSEQEKAKTRIGLSLEGLSGDVENVDWPNSIFSYSLHHKLSEDLVSQVHDS